MEKHWKKLELMSYTTVGVVTYWGLFIMIISVIEGRPTNFLIWIIGMVSSCAALYIIPKISISNILIVMALTWISTNYFGFNFGESEKVNLFVILRACGMPMPCSTI